MMSERSSATAFAFAFFNGGGLAIGGAGVAAFTFFAPMGGFFGGAGVAAFGVVPTTSTSLSDCSDSGVIGV